MGRDVVRGAMSRFFVPWCQGSVAIPEAVEIHCGLVPV